MNEHYFSIHIIPYDCSILFKFKYLFSITQVGHKAAGAVVVVLFVIYIYIIYIYM